LYPTAVKLLWECCEWVFEKQLFRLCKLFGTKRPKSKYTEQKIKHMACSRRRKNSFKSTLKRRKSLVYLLEKGVGQLQDILSPNQGNGMATEDFSKLAVIKKVLIQQRFLLTNPPSELKNRIVSLYKPYLRPIGRGKENKPADPGSYRDAAKGHVLQVDGLTFIDKLDINPKYALGFLMGLKLHENQAIG